MQDKYPNRNPNQTKIRDKNPDQNLDQAKIKSSKTLPKEQSSHQAGGEKK